MVCVYDQRTEPEFDGRSDDRCIPQMSHFRDKSMVVPENIVKLIIFLFATTEEEYKSIQCQILR